MTYAITVPSDSHFSPFEFIAIYLYLKQSVSEQHWFYSPRKHLASLKTFLVATIGKGCVLLASNG